MPPNGNGQVSEFDPHAGTLTLMYQSAIDNPALDMPDNMVIALRTGDLFLCEDNGANNNIRGLTEGGLIFDFAEAKTTPTEFCRVASMATETRCESAGEPGGVRGHVHDLGRPWKRR